MSVASTQYASGGLNKGCGSNKDRPVWWINATPHASLGGAAFKRLRLDWIELRGTGPSCHPCADTSRFALFSCVSFFAREDTCIPSCIQQITCYPFMRLYNSSHPALVGLSPLKDPACIASVRIQTGLWLVCKFHSLSSIRLLIQRASLFDV